MTKDKLESYVNRLLTHFSCESNYGFRSGLLTVTRGDKTVLRATRKNKTEWVVKLMDFQVEVDDD
jgi:hypothetical protein